MLVFLGGPNRSPSRLLPWTNTRHRPATSELPITAPHHTDRLQNQGDPNEIPADLAAIQPPLDYAPKTSPDEKGMLNEEFGLDRNATEAKTVEAPRV